MRNALFAALVTATVLPAAAAAQTSDTITYRLTGTRIAVGPCAPALPKTREHVER